MHRVRKKAYKDKNIQISMVSTKVTPWDVEGVVDYDKLIKPSELKKYIDDASLNFEEVRGMSYLPLFDIVKLTDDSSVNYIIHATKK